MAGVQKLISLIAFYRFGSTFLGSRAVTGSFIQQGFLTKQDASGQTLAEVLTKGGHDSSAAALAKIAMKPADVKGYALPQGCTMQLLCHWLHACTDTLPDGSEISTVSA